MLQVALLLVMWDDLKPKFDPEMALRPQRPELQMLPEVEPLDLELPSKLKGPEGASSDEKTVS